MKVYLNVDYSEKSQAKELGAKWDKDNKSWYAENPKIEILEKFGINNHRKNLHNTSTISAIKARCKQHFIDSDSYVRSLRTNYELLEKEGVKIPITNTVEETIEWLIENGLLLRREERAEITLNKKEARTYVRKAFAEKGITRDTLTEEIKEIMDELAALTDSEKSTKSQLDNLISKI